MSGDSLGPELCANLQKHIFLERLNWVIAMVEKSLKNYIEWCPQRTKRSDFGQRYDGTVYIVYIVHIVYIVYMVYIVFSVYNVYDVYIVYNVYNV